MAKYQLLVREISYVSIDVEADTPEEAKAKAGEIYESGECPPPTSLEYDSETLFDEFGNEVVVEG